MKKKLVSKILWHGNDIDGEGNPIYPIAASDKNHLDGLNRGEIYIQDNDNSPQIVIRTDKGNIKPIISGGSGGGGDNTDIDIIRLNDSRNLTDENVLSSLRALYEIQSRIVKEGDLNTVLRDNNVFSSLRTLYEIRSRIIKKSDTTENTDDNVLSALRTMFEIQSRILKKDDTKTEETDDNTLSSIRIIAKIKDAISTLEGVYLSRKNDDIAEGHITFNQGVYIKGSTVGDGQSILEEDNSVIEEGNGIIEESLQVPIPATSTLGGLDNVDDIVDIPSNKDVILVKKAGSTEWTQEDKTSSDTIPEAPKDGKQYARQDGAWSEVKATSVDVPTKLSELENDADYVQDPNYIHTDNNFSDLLKSQLSDLNTEYLNVANKLNYQRARTFFSKTHADTNSVWGFVRYFNNLPTLTATQVKITGVRSDFNGDLISDSYVNIPGATQTLAGIMTAADKTKLDGIEAGATRVIVDSLMSETSLNPVQNKVITSKIIQIEGRTTGLETQYSTLSNTLSPIKAAWDKRGTKDGLLLLGDNNLIPSQYLPSYVDDVVDVYATYDKSATGVLSNIKLYTNAAHTTAVVPETGKIYIDITSGKPSYQFRWSGTTYIDLNTGGLILGTIAGTAFEGDKGNILYTNFGEGDNLLYTQKARDFFKSLAVGVSFISNLEVGSVSETSANLVYDSNVFGATTNRITFALPVADSNKAGIISAYDKIFIDDIKSKVGEFVTLDTPQTITEVKKITSYLSFVSGTRKINISGNGIEMYSYPSGGSAQSIKFCDSNGNLLSSFGYMVNDNTLNSVYLGTGYEESKHWVTFTPSKTTIRGKAEVKGSLMISPGASGLNGIIATNGNGLLMYGDDATYLSQNTGITYIRSGNENLYHTKAGNNYIILDQINTPHVFCRKGEASASHVDLTDTTANAVGFVDYTSGAYRVSRNGSTAMYIKFQGSGSTSGLELYTNYVGGASLQFRKIVDNNRISGAWSYLLDDRNWNRYVKFDSLTDKPFISVDATPNSLVKRTSTGFINCNLAGVTFYDTAYSTNPQNGWVITTATNYGKTSKDLKIKQYVGTGGNLFLNDYRVATAKDKYVMSKYTIDASNLDEDTYYPVTIKLNSGHNYRIEVLVQLDSGTKPSWSTHNSGFAVRFIEEIQGYGWGTINTIRKIIDFEYSHCIGGSYPVKRVMQMTNSSTEVIYVRGGGRYFFFVSGSSFNAPEPILRTSTYTENSQSVSPTPSADLVFNVSRNIIMSDDVAIEPVGGKIAQRDVNGYLRAIRYYTTTPAEDYAISHIAFFYNSDGYIRKTPLSGLNRQLMFGSLNGLITYNTEHNFIPDNFNNDVWINNRTTAGSSANTTINEYRFRNGNSSGEYSYLRARGFIKQSSNDRYALTGAGGHMLITYDGTANALVQRDASGNVTANSYFFQGSSAKIGPNCIELYSSTTPYIDFHYGNSSDDYTTRIIEDGKSHLQIYANVGVRVSGNITAPGFDRVGSSDSFVLLGGGGHKLVSEFVDRTSNQNISGFKNFFTTATDGNYGTRAIVLRETNMGKDANKSELYAPSLSFHWGNVAQAVMSMHTNGQIYFTQTTTDGNAIYVNARGYVKNDSDNDHALTGGGGHVPFSIDATAHSLVKRTSDGSIRAKDVISSNYVLHTDVNNPYLRLRSVSTDYFIQAYESGIWMGPADTAKSLIISSTGNAGLGILPNDSYKLYVNGNIRSSNTINAGEVVNMAYGYINVSRPKTIENASCFSWIRETTSAFALGFNSSNQIVLGQGKTDKTLTPWLKIGASSSQFQSHLNTQTVSTEYGEFNHDLGRMLSTTATVTGIICITLPQGWIYSMNMYEIYIYEYTNTVCGSRILISGYNYGATPAWVNCKYTSEGNYSRSVRLGYKGGKCCILLGDIDSVWAYPQVFLANVYNGYSGLGSWKTGYTIGVITSTSDVTNIVTVQRSYSNAAGFMKDGSSDSYVLLGAGGHLSYSESATSNSLVKRSGNGYIFGKFFHSDNPVQDTLTVTNLFFETGSDGYHRKASLGHVTDTMRVATQTLKGLMSAEDKKKVDLFDPSKYIRRDIDDDALGHLTFHAGIYVDGGVYSGQSILEADGVNGIMEANGNNIIEYSEPAPIATSMTLGELTNVSSSVNTAASSKVMLVKGAGETLWTQEVITPNILKGFADTRTVATTPNDYNSKFSVVGIKQNSKIGSPNSETYSYLIGYRGWSDSSGGKSHELGFNNQGIYHRIGSTTAWESWEKILTSANWNSFITIPVIPDMSTYAKKDFSNVTTQSLGQNGYCKFPNGLLIQWGKNTSTITIRIVSLPTPFLDGNYIVTANMSSTSVTEEVSDIRIGNKTTEAFSVRIPTQPSGNTSSENFEWIAIGRWK